MALLPTFLVVALAAPLISSSGCRASSESDTTDPDARSEGMADAGRQIDAQPQADAMPTGTTCTTKEPIVQLAYTCRLEWSMCTSDSAYAIDCRIQNIAGNVFSLCDCLVDGAETAQFGSGELCGLGSWEEVEALSNQECGWDLR